MEIAAGSSESVSTEAPQQASNEGAQNNSAGQNGGETGGQKTPPQPPKMSSSEAEYFDVKVNGKTQRMTKQEVLNYASLSHTAQSKFDEASKIRKENDRIREMAKKNPMQALLDPAMGLDKAQLREALEEWYSREYIEPETLTAEQRQLKDYQTRLQAYEAQEKEAKDQVSRQQEEQLTNHHRETFQKQIIGALEASGMARTPFFASRMAFYMQQNLANGWEAPQELIVQQVKKEHDGIFSQLKQRPIEEVIQVLGDDFINMLRKHDLAQLRERRKSKSTDFMPSEDAESKKESVSMRDVDEKLRHMRIHGF